VELNATAKVIIGMLAARPRSGYEIKQLVDHSARYFWAASYGRIYPELKRLERDGLVAGTDAPQGGRQRTVYQLTDAGERAAREWLARPPEVFETRDEGLLKLFFAGVIDPERAPEIARERAAASAAVSAQLNELELMLQAEAPADGPGFTVDVGSMSVLRYGIEVNEWAAAWWERKARDLEQEKASKGEF
jgi:PadR family transcriptional regulator, regulatory protein AphA